jgi:hypothetical protein
LKLNRRKKDAQDDYEEEDDDNNTKCSLTNPLTLPNELKLQCRTKTPLQADLLQNHHNGHNGLLQVTMH